MQQKSIIALRGEQNAGKTRTIIRVYESLTGEEVTKKEVNALTFDYEGVKVGITSVGDEYPRLSKHLRKLQKAGCMVIVCACRAVKIKPESRTMEAVQELVPPYVLYPDWQNKETDPSDRAVNEAAEGLIAIVRDAVDLARPRHLGDEVGVDYGV